MKPETDAQRPELDEIWTVKPQQQLLLPSQGQQSIQNAHC